MKAKNTSKVEKNIIKQINTCGKKGTEKAVKKKFSFSQLKEIFEQRKENQRSKFEKEAEIYKRNFFRDRRSVDELEEKMNKQLREWKRPD